MGNFKQKAKELWKDNWGYIVAGGLGLILAGGTGFMISKMYKDGFVDGGMVGFHAAMEWLDETFPEESKAKALYEAYCKAHPEEIVHRQGLGKWS